MKVSVTYDPKKAPLTLVVQPGQIDLITTMLRAATQSDKFRFECQL